MIDLDALEAAASIATPGPWVCLSDERRILATKADRSEVLVCDDFGMISPNRAFIAVANPAVILALCARVRELEAALALQKKLTDGFSSAVFELEAREAEARFILELAGGYHSESECPICGTVAWSDGPRHEKGCRLAAWLAK